MSEDDILYWQDVLDQINAGRVKDLRCPFCQKGEVAVDQNAERTRVECKSCRRFVEGRFE
jgi:hypothetical protein